MNIHVLSLVATMLLFVGCATGTNNRKAGNVKVTSSGPASCTLSIEEKYFSIGNARQEVEIVVLDAMNTIRSRKVPIRTFAIHETIDRIIEERGFKLKEKNELRLLSESLNAKQLDCSDRTLIHLEVAARLGVEREVVHAPLHVFIALSCMHHGRVFWEILYGERWTREFYVNRFKIHGTSLRKGVYMVPRPATEIFACVYSKLGLKLIESDRNGEAENVLRQALAVSSTHAAAEFLLGIALRYEGKSSAAREAVKRSIALDPNFKDRARVEFGEMFKKDQP